MNRIVPIMILLFVLEGALVPWLIPESIDDRLIPHFIFVMVIFAALYRGRFAALVLGAGFGLLQDIVYYGHMLGVHFFLMAIIGYFTGLLLEKKRVTLLMAMSVIGLSCIVYDSITFGIYAVFRITNASYTWSLIHYIVPSLFLQLAFALALYIPLRRMFQSRISTGADDEEE
ncbi:rod shape-determining protein MreD [Paenibacillus chungangensis]|uniref:Rod shape-determining protein MreD n=1 Tax=Paenibacillus chungangensis TaxID=696535 RepID=A0ABW3HYL4_9BACL